MQMIENELRTEGFLCICGVDEAGRGSLAGPVFAAAVILPFGLEITGLDDSKKLSKTKREYLYSVITSEAVAYAIASASHTEIDELNIQEATFLAMNRAVEMLSVEPDISIVDGNRSSGINFKCITVIGGDSKSASVAAASVLAKVTRDRYMTEIAKEYPQYDFEKHKGYGTKLHYEKLRDHGPSNIHRSSFLKKTSSWKG